MQTPALPWGWIWDAGLSQGHTMPPHGCPVGHLWRSPPMCFSGVTFLRPTVKGEDISSLGWHSCLVDCCEVTVCILWGRSSFTGHGVSCCCLSLVAVNPSFHLPLLSLMQVYQTGVLLSYPDAPFLCYSRLPCREQPRAWLTYLHFLLSNLRTSSFLLIPFGI